MRDIEAKNPQLTGVLPKTYQIFNSTLLKNLLKKVSEIPATAEGDTFGRVYEYFLGEFARTEGSRAVSSIRRSASFACSSRCWSRFTVGFSTRPAAPAACSSRAPVSWRSTSTVPRLS